MAEEIKNRAFEARAMYRSGAIGRAEAKAIIQPYIDLFNSTSRRIAAKYGMRAKTISFAGFIR